MRILLLTPDAFGGVGGIAQYNRDLILALSQQDFVRGITAIPRNIPGEIGEVPKKLNFQIDGAGGKLRYLLAVLKSFKHKYNLVICSHINLLPVAVVCGKFFNCPVILIVYGIEVWSKPANPIYSVLMRYVREIWSISEITRDKMNLWANEMANKYYILPNAINIEKYGVGAKNDVLLKRHNLHGKKIVMILGRLDAAERYKGVDELLELLPKLKAIEPKICLLVGGDGNDRSRLESKAKASGLHSDVVFTGYIEEAEKKDYYRLADAFVMPSRGEGFGFVLLEAMACGVPVVASSLDGTREAVRFGDLGQVVDPSDATRLVSAILESISKPKQVSAKLSYFAFSNFKDRIAARLEKFPVLAGF